MIRILRRCGDRLLGAVVPHVTADAASCWKVCCNSDCRWTKWCCSDGINTWCYQCEN